MSIDLARSKVATVAEEVRRLAHLAVDNGHYEEVEALSRLAAELTRLSVAEGHKRPDPSNSVQVAADSSPSEKRRRSNNRGNTPAITRLYPRYGREGRYLVKAGWSQKERAEYQHKASIEAVKGLAQQISECGKLGTVFSVDESAPIGDGEGGTMPAYQIYVALGWLRAESLIEKQGRSGYQPTPTKSELVTEVQRRWKTLKPLHANGSKQS